MFIIGIFFCVELKLVLFVGDLCKGILLEDRYIFYVGYFKKGGFSVGIILFESI